MSRVRVLHVIARMNVGGPAVLISDLLRQSDSTRFDQQLATGWCAPDEADLLLTQATDIEAIRVEGLGRAVKPWSDVSALASLTSLIRQLQPDIIHTHTAKAGVIGRMAAKIARSGAAVVHTYHGHLLHGYFGPAKTNAVVRAERTLARSSDALVAVGERVRDDLIAAGIGRSDQYEVIYPGVDIGAQPSKHEARLRLGLAEGSFVVGYLGRLTGIKRPDRLIDVARILAPNHSDLVFLVAGSGDKAELIQEASRRLPIQLLGWRDDVGTVLAACDALLLTSDNEGTPLSILQALHAGLPVVSTDVGSIPEVIRHGETGLLAPPSVSKLADALTTLVDNPQEAIAMGQRGATEARSRFSVDQWVKSHEALYDRLAR
jgi:glycosyltransferase involved in cell wall biosynthesis